MNATKFDQVSRYEKGGVGGDLLKHDYLSRKCVDFIKKYNQELSSMQQDNTYYNLSLSGSDWAHQQNGGASELSLQRQEGQQDALLKNSRRLQKLALMQVIASTVAANLHVITTQCNDRLLQKSMAGNLHQWLVEQNEAFLSDYDEFSSHMSLLGRQRGGSTLRGGSF